MTRLKAHAEKLIGYFQPFDWHHALVAAPGMAACLIYGLVTGDTLTAAIAAGSAFSVGFGLRRYRQTRSMLGCVALMTVAALIGSLTAGNFVIYLVLMAAASAACACCALIDDDLWWVTLQATIALLLASHYAGDAHAAFLRAGIVMGAGLFQMACVMILYRLIPLSQPKPVLNIPIPATRKALTIYGSVAALSVVVAMLVAYGVHLDKAYWAPMTALIVLKPKYHLTRQRGLERLMGNLAGCTAATGLTFLLPVGARLDILLCVLGSGAAYALIKARYAAFSLAVSFTVVMLLYSAHASALAGSEQRLYATVIGGVIAIAVMWLASRTVARDYAM
ncbi:FUSC family protein [Asticcacaulis sp. EMRT-3]|uniref:FUSC family protein n=1 Tax=Asticcacaulis sp. EMRT-3 TaxID=3040349 RepID=UPI0024AFA31E|nr:FUSC family protein [Asticcacaulis sp. EMRT-3]MDI7775599.1 FUSC family protein [Asticcacaulis sp. EMRT-3]